MATAQQKIASARTSLVLEQPFFGSLVLSLKTVEDPGCKTAWTDGRSIGYDPAFIEGLNHSQITALLAHEVMHCAAGHPWRRDARDHKRFNVACDKAINHELRESGYTLPPNAYYADGDERGKSAEWIYAHTSEPQGQGKQPQANPQAAAQGQGQPQPGAGQGTPDPLGEVRDAPTQPDADGEPAPTEQDWKQRTAQAAQQAKMAGELPGGLERLVKQALKPRLDIRSLLLRFFSERATADYSWTRPAPRYLARGFYLPCLESKSMGEVAVMVDTSGSVDEKDLAYARGILQDVLDECEPAGVTLYFADTKVAHVERLEKGDPLVWTPKGGGGTDFRAALKAIEDQGDAVCAVCISDLDGRFPDVAPNLPVLWLSTVESAVAPFGETVYAGN